MEQDDSLSDPDVKVLCQLLGTADCFEVCVPSRARVSWLKNGIAKEMMPSGPPLSPSDFKIVHDGRVLKDSDVVGKLINKNTKTPFTVVLESHVDAHMGIDEEPAAPVVDQISLLHAMRWLMDHGHTAPEVDNKSKEVEDILAFYRRHNDLVLPSDLLKDSELNSLLASPNERRAAPAPAAPIAPLPPIELPRRWFDMYLIVKIVLGLYLFGEDLPLPAQIAAGILYYLFASGILVYLWKVGARRYFGNDTPFREPQAAFVARYQATGIPRLLGNLTVVPSTPGLFWDCCAFFGGLFFSLYPGWGLRPSAGYAPPPEAENMGRGGAAAAPEERRPGNGPNNDPMPQPQQQQDAAQPPHEQEEVQRR